MFDFHHNIKVTENTIRIIWTCIHLKYKYIVASFRALEISSNIDELLVLQNTNKSIVFARVMMVCLDGMLAVYIATQIAQADNRIYHTKTHMMMVLFVCRKHRRCAHMLHRRQLFFCLVVHQRAAVHYVRAPPPMSSSSWSWSSSTSMMTYIYAKQHRPICYTRIVCAPFRLRANTNVFGVPRCGYGR